VKQRVWVVVADSYRARVFEVGEERRLVEAGDLFHTEARELSAGLGADRPGRVFDSVGGHRHAIEEKTAPHEREVLRFVAEIGEMLERNLNRFDALVMLAPPKMLGMLRGKISGGVQAKIKHELALDIVDEPVEEINERVRPLLKPEKREPW